MSLTSSGSFDTLIAVIVLQGARREPRSFAFFSGKSPACRVLFKRRYKSFTVKESLLKQGSPYGLQLPLNGYIVIINYDLLDQGVNKHL